MSVGCWWDAGVNVAGRVLVFGTRQGACVGCVGVVENIVAGSDERGMGRGQRWVRALFALHGEGPFAQRTILLGVIHANDSSSPAVKLVSSRCSDMARAMPGRPRATRDLIIIIE